jgi:hypothetical protein
LFEPSESPHTCNVVRPLKFRNRGEFLKQCAVPAGVCRYRIAAGDSQYARAYPLCAKMKQGMGLFAPHAPARARAPAIQYRQEALRGSAFGAGREAAQLQGI